MKKLFSWKKHHNIEFFGGALAVVIILLIANVATIKHKASKEDMAYVAQNAYYASDFMTSLSGLVGHIQNVYVNEDYTKCGIVVQYENPTYVVSDANEYSIFIKSYDVEKQKYNLINYNVPVGGYYVFGSTGYAMIYLSDASGFKGIPMEVVVRCNTVINNDLDNVEEREAMAAKDASYAHYDQYRIIVNPYGSKDVVSFLDSGDGNTINPVELYQHTVLVATENEIRKTLKDDVDQLNMYATRIRTFRDRLDSNDVAVPKYPDAMKNDAFYNKDDEAKTLVYTPGYIYPGGVDFDWQSDTLVDGHSFLDSLAGNMSHIAYLRSLSDAKTGDVGVMTSQWSYKDGTSIVITNDESGYAMDVAISNDITQYEQALNDYLSLKYKYLTGDLVSYLKLEYDIESTSTSFSANLSDDCITVW